MGADCLAILSPLSILCSLRRNLHSPSSLLSTMSSPPPLNTPLTKLLGIKYPIMLAGMARTSGGPLAAAVSNAGGIGTIGGLGYTPKQLQEIIDDLKSNLADPSLPFGVDLALPQVGGSARKTNHDYTHGQLDELIEVTIRNGAKLFVSAVGVPPARTIKRLHEAGILVMNMVGAPKHAEKALRAGVDIVCAQGGEGGGHTGDIANSILIPAVCDVARNYKSPVTADFADTLRTLVVSGRPLRCRMNDYVKKWEDHPERIKELRTRELCLWRMISSRRT